MSDLISIITRTYGPRTTMLPRTAASVLSQSYKPIEWLVVEDGTNEAWSHLAAIPEKEGLTIRHLAIPKGGRSAAANFGLENTTGAYFGFLDDDDELYANHIETLAHLLKRFPNAGGAYAASLQSHIAGYSAEGAPLVEREDVFITPTVNSTPLLSRNLFPIQAVLVRRNILHRHRFDKRLDALEDWLFWLQLFLEKKMVWTPEITSRFYVPSNELARQNRLEAHRIAMPYFSVQRDALLQERGLGDIRFLQSQYAFRLLDSAYRSHRSLLPTNRIEQKRAV